MSLALKALESAEQQTMFVAEALAIVNATRCASGTAAWREACDCIEDIILIRAARDRGIEEQENTQPVRGGL